MRPGYKTTEFWVTIGKVVASFALTLLVMFGILNQDDANQINDHVMSIILAIVAIVINGMAVIDYTHARRDVKREEVKKSTNIEPVWKDGADAPPVKND